MTAPMCHLCAVRAKIGGTGPCDRCRAALRREMDGATRAAISSIEPPTKENFDVTEILETSLRQARKLQKVFDVRLGAETPMDLELGCEILSKIAKTLGLLVPVWAKLREMGDKNVNDMTGEEMEALMVGWVAALPKSRAREVWQTIARRLNEEKTA